LADLRYRTVRHEMEWQLEDVIGLNRSKPEGAAAGGFAFDGAELVLAAVELDAFEFSGFAVFDDSDVLLGEILEQVFLGVGAAGGPAYDADDVVEVVERDLVADHNVLAFAGFTQFVDG